MKLYTIREVGLGMTREEVLARMGPPSKRNPLPGEAMFIPDDSPLIWNFDDTIVRIQFSGEGRASRIDGDVLEVAGKKVAEFGSRRCDIQETLGPPQRTLSLGLTQAEIYDGECLLEIRYKFDRVVCIALQTAWK